MVRAFPFAAALCGEDDIKLVSVAILAGGQSKRMGRDKAFLELGGQLVIERVIATVAPLTDDLLLGTNSPEQYARFGNLLEALTQ